MTGPMTDPSTGRGGRAVVVGAGLAGTSAALTLADQGWDVTLLEARPRLGGAVYSFARDGMPADTGQHVLLRCYTGYRALVRRLGMEDLVPVQERMDIPVLRPGRPALHLRRTPHTPAPLHLGVALARYSALTPLERARAAWAMTALRGVDYTDPASDEETFGHWLRAHGQSERALANLWSLVTVAALNIGVDEASLALAAMVFRVGLLEAADAGDIGVAAVPLSEIHHGATTALLDRLGIEWHVGRKVQQIARLDRRYVLRTADGDLEADAVVLAVPHHQAAQLAPEAACPDRDRWAGLGASAIYNVHVRYDRTVTDLPFAAAVDSPVPWFFDRTAAAGVDGQYLTVSVSAASPLLDQVNADLRDTQLRGLAALLPAAADATVLDSWVTREPRATFAQRAGSRALRPGPATRWPGFVLAGAWTDTGWPDTMEGAVRSGLTAGGMLGGPGHTSDQHQIVRTV